MDEELLKTDEVRQEVDDDYDFFVSYRENTHNKLVNIEDIMGVLMYPPNEDWGYFIEDETLFLWKGKYMGSEKIGTFHTREEVDELLIDLHSNEIANKL